MKVHCPSCGREVPADQINIQEMAAACPECGELFSIADAAKEAAAPPLLPEPANTKVYLVRDRDERIGVALPRGGFKGLGCFLVFFSLFWNGITWTIVIAGITQFGKEGKGMGVFMLLFMIPFVLIGLGMAVGALWAIFGRTSVALSRSALIVERALFGLRWRKTYKIEDIESIGMREAYKRNGHSKYGVGIELASRRMPVIFGSSLTEDERKWILGELYDFWMQVKPAAA